MGKRKTPLLETDTLPEPARVAEVLKVADREERKQRLSGILRDGTGPEVVAAARLLESMERTDSATVGTGLPPPTIRPEQVARMVRLLGACAPAVTLEALEILAQRYERGRVVAMQNRKDGKLFDITTTKAYRGRILPREEQKREQREKLEQTRRDREGLGPGSESGGAAATEPEGLSELHQAAEPVGPPSHSDEQNGDGAGAHAPEDGEI